MRRRKRPENGSEEEKEPEEGRRGREGRKKIKMEGRERKGKRRGGGETGKKKGPAMLRVILTPRTCFCP